MNRSVAWPPLVFSPTRGGERWVRFVIKSPSLFCSFRCSAAERLRSRSAVNFRGQVMGRTKPQWRRGLCTTGRRKSAVVLAKTGSRDELIPLLPGGDRWKLVQSFDQRWVDSSVTYSKFEKTISSYSRASPEISGRINSLTGVFILDRRITRRSSKNPGLQNH